MKFKPQLGRAAACAIIFLLWAAIYLPGLGMVEIKGEEIRRIMPGMAMLQSGDWIVPQFNGQPYLRKPPLVNWAIALSVKMFGVRNEWTARFPSVLAVLILAMVMFISCAGWLGVRTALAAVVIAIANPGMVEKGRLAEIEAIYVALFGMAMACWLGWTATGRSRWLLWPVTGLLLGLGLLAKGPPHLAYFYLIAGSIAFLAWKRRHAGEADVQAPLPQTWLASWAHLAGVAIMLGVFALWCIPYLRETARLGAAGVWARQMEQRVGGGSAGTIFANFGRSLVNFLPWAAALPLFWRRATLERLDARDRLLVEAARWPLVGCAFFLMFIPGMLPRYTLPLLVPFALLLALVLKAATRDRAFPWILLAGAILGCGMIVVDLVFGSRLHAQGAARAFGRAVNALAPPGNAVCIFDPTVQPEVFYIDAPLYFQDKVKALPNDVPCLVAPESAVKLLRSRFQESRVLAQPKDAGGRTFFVLQLRGRH